MPNLESEVMRSVRALCEHGDTLVSMKEYSFAISKYYEALSLIPDPKKEYKAATWIYTSIGETYWKQRDFNNAGMAFLKAVKSVGGKQIARVNLRLGECLYECGDSVHSTEYLCQAYMLEGENAFRYEDPKYFAAIKPEVIGAPDDDDYDDDFGKDDYYLVDTLGDDILPDPGVDPAAYDSAPAAGEPEEPDENDIFESYDRSYYADDTDGGAAGDEEQYEDGQYGYADEEARDYFDGGEEEEYDYDDEEDYEESPIKRAIDWFIGLFK